MQGRRDFHRYPKPHKASNGSKQLLSENQHRKTQEHHLLGPSLTRLAHQTKQKLCASLLEYSRCPTDISGSHIETAADPHAELGFYFLPVAADPEFLFRGSHGHEEKLCLTGVYVGDNGPGILEVAIVPAGDLETGIPALRPLGSPPTTEPKYICAVVGRRLTRYLPPFVFGRPFRRL